MVIRVHSPRSAIAYLLIRDHPQQRIRPTWYHRYPTEVRSTAHNYYGYLRPRPVAKYLAVFALNLAGASDWP